MKYKRKERRKEIDQEWRQGGRKNWKRRKNKVKKNGRKEN